MLKHNKPLGCLSTGMPPRLLRPPLGPPGIPPPSAPPQQSGNVLSAPPSIVKPPQLGGQGDEGKKSGATIQVSFSFVVGCL